MKKIFEDINLTWKKIIIVAIIIGLYTGIVAMIEPLKDTSFTDLAVSFEVWILFGILIIINSKSAKDSALKCFVFFLISQPLIYLIQDVVHSSHLFTTYYKYWFMWTIACLPMGYIGYYMKKNKWWGLLILTPILLFLGTHLAKYFSETMFSFPRHLLTTIFCIVTLIIYPIYIFKNKKIRIIGLIISIVTIISMIAYGLVKPIVYSTDLLSSGDEYQFDDTYKVYLLDKKYGDLSIKYEAGIETWMVHAEFRKAGKTKFILESPDGKKNNFNITIARDSYEVEKK